MHIAKQAHLDSKQRRRNNIDPLEMFAAYHLGLQLDDTVAFYNGPQVARSFSLENDEFEELLKYYQISSADLVHTNFDLVGARMDMEYSPAGADLWLVAQMHFENFVDGCWEKRDWNEDEDIS